MNFFIRFFIKNLIFLNILKSFNTKVLLAITCQPLHNYKTLQTGTFYLNSERPLWILEDQRSEPISASLGKPFKENVKYEHLKPIYYRNRQQQQPKSPFNQRNYRNFKNKAQKRLQLHHHHYIPLKKDLNSNRMSPMFKNYRNTKFIQNMPVFDAVPGEETYTETRPIFVYTGNKGRMLLNTMLSEKKYPMKEPVPGQILYPPPTIVFKPKSLVENLQQKINVTMIPFYAYEAIDPTYLTTTPTSFSTDSTRENYTVSKKRKKTKHYKAYYARQEVLAQPFNANFQHHYQQLEYTTNSPATLEKPFTNHRLSTEPLTSTTALPHKKFEVTYDDGADKFQITYEDDIPSPGAYLERPIDVEATTTPTVITTTSAPQTYESYKFNDNYYAFPLYTMSKLMETKDFSTPPSAKLNPEDSTNNIAEVSVEQQKIEKLIDTALREENNNLTDNSNEDTWFILNSRYKGPLQTSSTSNLHSSKYVQITSNKLFDALKHEMKTKPRTTRTTTKREVSSKSVLQPKRRSLYGENISI